MQSVPVGERKVLTCEPWAGSISILVRWRLTNSSVQIVSDFPHMPGHQTKLIVMLVNTSAMAVVCGGLD